MTEMDEQKLYSYIKCFTYDIYKLKIDKNIHEFIITSDFTLGHSKKIVDWFTTNLSFDKIELTKTWQLNEIFHIRCKLKIVERYSYLTLSLSKACYIPQSCWKHNIFSVIGKGFRAKIC